MQNAERYISESLIKRGFLQKGKNYHMRLENDAIILLCFEKPTKNLYVQFALIPVFLPCIGLYYSYGNRLNRLFPDVGVLVNNPDSETVHAFCSSVIQHLDNDLLPFANRISDAKNLCIYVKEQINSTCDTKDHYVFCPPDNLMRLLMYGLLYLNRYEEALNAANDYYCYLRCCKIYSKELLEKKIDECQQIIKNISLKQYHQIETIIERNIQDNLRMLPNNCSRS